MGRGFFDRLFFRNERNCPPWLCFTFDNPFRRFLHDPRRMFGEVVAEGDTAIDVGAGKGYFTIPLAGLVGPRGRVIAADLHAAMLRAIERRARTAGVGGRIETRLTARDALGISEKADFILMFWMLHEVPDQARLLREVAACLRPSGRVFLAEPKLHVTKDAFEASVRLAALAGLVPFARPPVSLSRAVLLGGARSVD